MCGLCGLWGETAHWTSASNALGLAQPAGSEARIRARALQQASIARAVHELGVTVRDWNGSSWVVASAQGGTEIVGGLPEIWRAAEALAGRRLDPLSPKVFDAVANRRRAARDGRE